MLRICSKQKKLDPRAKKAIFIGYDKYSPAYFVFYPETNSVKKVRLVKFTNEFDARETTQQIFESENNIDLDDARETTQQIFESIDDQSIASDSTLPVLIDNQCDLSENTFLISSEEDNYIDNQHDDIEDDITPPNSFMIEKSYPSRERKPPGYLNDYTTGEEFSDSEFFNSCTTNVPVPANYNEAMHSPVAEKWKAAMERELISLKENDTFTLVTPPKDKNVVGGRWVYSIKEGGEYKARYVAKGYSQIKDLDYHETYAPTTKMTTIRTLMQLCVQYDLIVHQMDVKSAYLNADIDCEIFVEQPLGCTVPGKEDLVWKLNKSLYGLKQSGRNWNDLLKKELLENGFVQSVVDPCMFIKKYEDKITIILVWVDDLLIAASDSDSLGKVKKQFTDKFQMKDLGQISKFLGIEFQIKPDEIKMGQSKYTEKVLKKFKMTDCKPRHTPCEQKLLFSKNAEPFDSTTYREAIGSLVYLATCTRPDISWVVNKLSQFNHNPTVEHWGAVKHVLRYLKGSINFSLTFRKCEDGLKVIGYTDADWGGSEDRKSTSGYCFSLSESGPVIAWRSQKQPTVALSTCEAEYVAMTLAVQEAEHLLQLLNNMDCFKNKLDEATLYSDNQSALCVAKNPIASQRIKHIDIKYHYIRDRINAGKIKVEYVPTDNNCADSFTKPLGRIRLDLVKPTLSGC